MNAGEAEVNEVELPVDGAAHRSRRLIVDPSAPRLSFLTARIGSKHSVPPNPPIWRRAAKGGRAGAGEGGHVRPRRSLTRSGRVCPCEKGMIGAGATQLTPPGGTGG